MSRRLVDLHRHLEGSIRTGTAVAAARRSGHPLGRAADPERLLVADDEVGDLPSYLRRVDAAAAPLVRPDDWRAAAREVVLDADREGLDGLELRFSPWFIAGQTGLAPEAVVDAVQEGVRQARNECDLGVGLVGILLRDLGPDSADQQLDTVLARVGAFCGVDLAGDEAGHPAAGFAPAFRRARDHGLALTCHAGEAAGPESIWAAVDLLGVDRIGHGVRAAHDPALMDRLAAAQITLEVAITSNVQTRAAPSLDRHPVRILVEHGVPVALSTDNPRVSGVTLAHEYAIAASAAGLNSAQLDRIAAQARRAAFF